LEGLPYANFAVLATTIVQGDQISMTLEHLVLTIAKTLCDEPEQVSVQIIVGENSDLIRVRVSDRDLGKMVGRQGRTADALRVVVNGAGRKVGRRYVLEIDQSSRDRSNSDPIVL
jgi:predicted RNA-binding protein YlqC (UPF0109 family)